jgi:hypothetical protein
LQKSRQDEPAGKTDRSQPALGLAPLDFFISVSGACMSADQAKLHRGDRAGLETLLAAVNGAMNALRRDACGDWTITGSRGTIRASGGKFYVYIPSGSAKAWTYAKRALASFALPSQDGDEEGILTFERMPDADEAETLRSYIGLRQTRDVSPDLAQNLRDHRQKGRTGSPMRQSGSEVLGPARISEV